MEDFAELTLREKIQSFVRAFGLLRNQTPCGKPISISMAHALMFVRTTKSDVTQSLLQKALFLNKSNITRLCLALESDGFIIQKESEADRRARLISLTQKGQRLSDSLLEASSRRFGNILSHIPKKDQSKVFEGLDLLTNAIFKANTTTIHRTEGKL